MGQKVNPYILRIGFNKDWKSRWFSNRKKEYTQFLYEDLAIRKLIRNFYKLGFIATVIIQRAFSTFVRIKIRTSRPGVIVGRGGKDIGRLKSKIIDLRSEEHTSELQSH